LALCFGDRFERSSRLSPGLKVGFFNGWWYLEWVSSMDLPRYLIQFLDPRNVTQGYRPVQGLYVLLQYTLFRFNSDGWLFTQMLLHSANSILLFAIVARIAATGGLLSSPRWPLPYRPCSAWRSSGTPSSIRFPLSSTC